MDDSQILTKRILKGSFIVLVFTILGAPLGYLIRILYSHTLSIEMYGLFYAVLALFSVLSTYNDLGFGYSVSYFVPKYFKKKDYTTCWNLYLYDLIIEVCTSIFISLLILIFGQWLALNYFKVPGSQNLIYLLCIYFIANSFVEALNRFFNGLQQEKFYSSIQFSRLFFILFFSAFFWLFDIPNILFFAISWSLGYIFVAIIYSFILYKFNSNLIKKFTWDIKLVKLMFYYAIPTLITTSIYTFITFTDTFFITLFRGVGQVGIYYIILPIVSIVSIFLSPINSLLFPLISHLMEKEKEKVDQLLNIILKTIPFVSLYFSLFIILFPSALVKYLFGEKWLGLVEIPLTILAVGFVASSLSGFLCTVVSAMGEVKQRLKVSITIALLNIILNGLLVFNFGVTGAVIANSIVFIFSVVLYGKIINKVIYFKYPYIFYLKIFIFSLFLFLLVRSFQIEPQSLLQTIIFGIVYTIIIFTLGLYLKIVDKNIFNIVSRMIKN